MSDAFYFGTAKKRRFFFCFALDFFVTLALPKLLALGNVKKNCFPFAFLSFFRNFADKSTFCIYEN